MVPNDTHCSNMALLMNGSVVGCVPNVFSLGNHFNAFQFNVDESQSDYSTIETMLNEAVNSQSDYKSALNSAGEIYFPGNSIQVTADMSAPDFVQFNEHYPAGSTIQQED